MEKDRIVKGGITCSEAPDVTKILGTGYPTYWSQSKWM